MLPRPKQIHFVKQIQALPLWGGGQSITHALDLPHLADTCFSTLGHFSTGGRSLNGGCAAHCAQAAVFFQRQRATFSSGFVRMLMISTWLKMEQFGQRRWQHMASLGNRGHLHLFQSLLLGFATSCLALLGFATYYLTLLDVYSASAGCKQCNTSLSAPQCIPSLLAMLMHRNQTMLKSLHYYKVQVRISFLHPSPLHAWPKMMKKLLLTTYHYIHSV